MVDVRREDSSGVSDLWRSLLVSTICSAALIDALTIIGRSEHVNKVSVLRAHKQLIKCDMEQPS